MRIDILTLFPEMFEPVIATSILGRARAQGKIDIRCHHIRNYTTDKHGRTDFPPTGEERDAHGSRPDLQCLSVGLYANRK